MASNLILPNVRTSKPNTAPANGVPNTETKPTLIPQIIKIFLSLLKNLIV